jgi:hypothetical protein
MNIPKVISQEDLLIQIDKTVLYQNLVQQLNKDFELAGISVNFKDDATSKDLFNELREVIAELLQKQFDDFLNMLYRVDVDEFQIRRIIHQANNHIEADISFIILKRIWQKVWFKKYY